MACGRDILVVEEETIDLASFEALAALAEEDPLAEHRLVFCLRYTECPTEDIPRALRRVRLRRRALRAQPHPRVLLRGRPGGSPGGSAILLRSGPRVGGHGRHRPRLEGRRSREARSGSTC